MFGLLARNWWALALRGVLAMIFGVVALLMPGITLEVLILLFGAYAGVDGIFAIVAGVRAARQGERWGALILEGVADIIAGAIALAGHDGFLYSIGFLVAWLVALLLVAELLRSTGRFTMGDVLAFRMRQRPVRAAAAISTLAVLG